MSGYQLYGIPFRFNRLVQCNQTKNGFGASHGVPTRFLHQLTGKTEYKEAPDPKTPKVVSHGNA